MSSSETFAVIIRKQAGAKLGFTSIKICCIKLVNYLKMLLVIATYQPPGITEHEKSVLGTTLLIIDHTIYEDGW